MENCFQNFFRFIFLIGNEFGLFFKNRWAVIILNQIFKDKKRKQLYVLFIYRDTSFSIFINRVNCLFIFRMTISFEIYNLQEMQGNGYFCKQTSSQLCEIRNLLHIKLIYRFQVVPQSVFEAVFETLGIKIYEFINQQQVEFIESFFFTYTTLNQYFYYFSLLLFF